MTLKGRVLAVQSHVVRGHVGADAFSFPLQALGLDVGCIYTCQFVDLFCHKGSQLEAEQLSLILSYLGEEVFEGPCVSGGKKAIEALSPAGTQGSGAPYETPFKYLVSGFVGRAELLNILSNWYKTIKETMGPLGGPLYICDPVMGDCNQLYVQPECIRSYSTQLLPLADVITPNQYEAGWLLGYEDQEQQEQQEQQQQEEAGWRASSSRCVALDTWSEILAAVEALHAKGPEVVVLTSVELQGAAAAEARAALAAAAAAEQQQQQQQDNKGEETLFIVASRKHREQQRCAPLVEETGEEKGDTAAQGSALEEADVLYGLAVTKKEGYVGGTGDLFAALFTGFFAREGFNLRNTLAKTNAAVQAVIRDTLSRVPRPQTVDSVSAQRFLLQPPQGLLRQPVRLQRSSSA